MFSIFGRKKSSIIDTGILEGMTDTHSHLIYGVDDGSKNSVQSNEMVDALKSMGIKRGFCTPHIKSELTSNTAEFLSNEFRTFQSYVENKGYETRLAAEYMLDEAFMTKLERGDLLTYDGKRILIEMSHISPPRNKREALFELNLSCYDTVLAHPERYIAYENIDTLKGFKDSGMEFQLNLLSLAGMYGAKVQALAELLLKESLYDYIGTDIHSAALLRYVENLKIDQKSAKLIEVLVANNNRLWV